MKLQNKLQKPTRKAIRNARTRTEPDPRVKHILLYLAKMTQNRPKEAFNQWKQTKMEPLVRKLKAEKLRNVLESIPRRKVKNTFERVLGDGQRLTGFLRRLALAAQKRPSHALRKWRSFVDDCKNKKLLDSLKAKKLQGLLEKIPNRTLRNTLERIMGDGDKIAGAIRRVAMASQRRPRDALRNWRGYVDKCKNKGLLDAVNANKLQHSLKKVPNRILKNTFDRIIGNGSKVSGAMRRFVLSAHRIPREYLAQWRKYVQSCKNGDVLNAMKARRLKEIMNNIPRKQLKDAYDRVIGDGNKVAGAMRRFVLSAQKIPGDCINKWRQYVQMCKNGDMMNAMKARRLREIMNSIPRKTLKDAFSTVTSDSKDDVASALKKFAANIEKRKQSAWTKWNQFVGACKRGDVMNVANANRLKGLLESIPRRTVKDAYERIQGGGDKIAGIMRRLTIEAQKKPKQAFNRWQKYVDQTKQKQLLDNANANRLNNVLRGIPRRTIKDAYERVIGGGNKMAGIMRRLTIEAQKKPKQAFNRWQKYVDQTKQKQLLNNANANRLNNVLRGIPRRTVKDAYERVLGSGNKMAGIMRRLTIEAQKKPKQAFNRWQKYIDQTKQKQLLDNANANRLNNVLRGIPRRTVKDAYERVLGSGNKMAGIMRRLTIEAQKKPKQAFNRWQKYIDQTKQKQLLDNANANKLNNVLRGIPRRRLKDAYERVLGSGNKMAGIMRRLTIEAQKKPKQAFNRWQKYVDQTKQKQLLNNANANRLNNVLRGIPRRTIKDAYERVLGSGNKMAGIMRRLTIEAQKKPKQAFDKWRAFND